MNHLCRFFAAISLVLAAFPYDAPLIGALALGLEAAGSALQTHSGLAATADQEANA